MGAVRIAVLAALALVGGAEAQTVRTAVFAGGCFWCMEPPYDKLDGVIATTSGYTGGHAESPTYEQVTFGDTGHLEAVEVTYDAERIDYETLLDVFWRNIDPFDDLGQFCDRGDSYRAAVFVANDSERELAEATRRAGEEKLGRVFLTRILERGRFYPAEDYHQDYYEKNPIRYNYYRFRCRRDDRLEQVWGERLD
ncbi:MAG: peptide-methionine (S)-S-oxide reductase MsrA [Gammaproteobacteria bacterium]|nr:peptide-methionine (S)-S-oxide reductase MsrA [Gammaproteobacteria bacterium]MXY53233.1 peptide-methionine (S)-S-oxide reductase MsrA [Gammaproteobacteria bacterium]